MTPKEKALDLLEAMTFSCRECDYEIRAKYCAIRAVDEILKAVDNPDETYLMKHSINYWTEVKQEIEKI
jgi:hypothetical protein